MEGLLKVFCSLILVGCLILGCSDEVSDKRIGRDDIDEKYRFIYDSINKGPDLNFFKYPVTDWKSIASNHPFDTPGTPSLGWKMLGPCTSLFHAYELTKDDCFLSLLGDVTEEIIKCRDDYKCRVSWNGVIYPLWASGRRSNNAYFEIKDSKGQTCAIIDFHGKGFDEVQISIIPEENATFDMFIYTKTDEYKLYNTTLDNLQSDISNIDWSVYVSPLPANKVLSARLLMDCKDVLVRREVRSQLSSYYMPALVNNAILINILINYYNILLAEHNKSMASRYYNLINESINSLLSLYLNIVGDKCKFCSPLNSPSDYGGGAVLPFNEQFSFAQVLARWYVITNKQCYLDLLRLWRNYFMSCLILNANGAAWKYWEDPSGTVSWMETESYGAIDVLALMIIKNNTDAFSESDIVEITSGLLKNLIMVNGEVVKTATDFSFKYYRDRYPNINYITLKDYLPEIKNIFESYKKVEKLSWMEQVDRLFYLSNNLERY